MEKIIPLEGKREAAKPQTQLVRSTACFKCGKESHLAAKCRAKTPAKKGEYVPNGKAAKSQPCANLKTMAVMEFSSSPKWRKGTLTPPEEDQGFLDTNYDDNPLVSGPIAPVTMPTELHLPGTEQKASPESPASLGMYHMYGKSSLSREAWDPLKKAKNPNCILPIRWVNCRGIPATFSTKYFGMTMGVNSVTFTVAPGIERPFILGLGWLKKWNPKVD